MSNIVQKIRGFLFKPRDTWEEVRIEETTEKRLFTHYVLILAAIPAIASILGWSVIGIRIPFSGVYRFTFFQSLIVALIAYVLNVAAILAIGLLIQKTAAMFHSNTDAVPAFKLVAGVHTPYLAAGLFYLVPNLGILVFLAGLYGLVLLWMGLPVVLNTPKSKAPAYMVVLVLTILVVHIVLQWIVGLFVGWFGPSLPSL